MKMDVYRVFVQCFTLLKIYGLTEIISLHVTFLEAAAPYMYKVHVPKPCPHNKYVIVYANGTKRCSRCSECSKGFEEQEQCSVYNDTKCEPCPFGWYNDVSGSRCKPCSGCEPGEYIRRSCKVTRNTKCRNCPRGTFSTYANETSCLPCKMCRRNEKRVSKCSRYRDTVCGDCVDDHFRVSSTDSCFPCSPCPSKLQDRVVPECRNKLGMDHSSICWPSERGFRLNIMDEGSLGIEIITEGIRATERDGEVLEMPYTFTTALLGSFLCCVLIIAVAFVCLRSIKCKKFMSIQYFGTSRETDAMSTVSREESNDDDTVISNDVTSEHFSKSLNSNRSDDSGNDYTSVFTNESLPLKFQDMVNETDGHVNSSQNWSPDCTLVIG